MNKKTSNNNAKTNKQTAKKPISPQKKASTTTTIEVKPSKNEIKQSEQPIRIEMSEEELKIHKSATRIQCEWRRHRARKQLAALKKEKKDLDEKLVKLERDAFLQVIKMEQEREEKKRMKYLKEKMLRQKREARKKKFLDAAYDGNLQELNFLISDLEKELDTLAADQPQTALDNGVRKQTILNLLDGKDSNDNTALSEASAGGSIEVIKFLLKNNANPNSKGAYGRTPLWRSAFAGHLNCVQILLENGADPRIYSSDGQKPIDAATKDNIIDLFKNWNIQLTERMLQQIDKKNRELKQEQIQGLDTRKKAARLEYQHLNKEYELVKNELYKCNCELQRLNDEYLLNEQMYGPLIDKKESEKVSLQLKYETLKEKVVKSRISYKDLLKEVNKEKRKLKKAKTTTTNENDDDADDDDDGGSGTKTKDEKDSDDDEEYIDDETFMRINIKEIDDIILRDIGDTVKNSVDKWPLILDQNEQASTFLRYRDTNYVNCLDMNIMQPNKFRLALLGSIRYGKPFVLDLLQYDQELLEATKVVCNQIDLNLFDEICNKTIVKNERYMRLVKTTDGKEYEAHNFLDIRSKYFKVLIITSNPYPSDYLLKITLPIKIVTSQKSDGLDFF
jgi:hypothetical protein